MPEKPAYEKPEQQVQKLKQAEHEQAKDVLRESEKKFAEVFRLSPNAFSLTRISDGTILEVNEGFARVFGYTNQDVKGKTSVELNIWVTESERNRVVEKLVAEGKLENEETQYRRKDDEIIDVHVSAVVIDVAEEQVILAEVMDITQRKQAEEALQASEKFLNTMIEIIPNMIFVKDAKELRFVRLNKAGEDLIGYSREDLIGKNDYDFFPKKEADFFTGKDREVLTSGHMLDIPEETIHTRYKGERILHTKKIPIITEKGSPEYLLGISEDITERKRAERALEKRVIALTRGLDDAESIDFEDLFKLDDIQRIQDEFAQATGVASIITRPDGTPITAGSNFCRLCSDIIRRTDKGLTNCFKSDSIIGRYNPDGPIIQTCLSGGLWDAGAAISIGGKHIANWLIGQVRDETQSEDNIRSYAHEISADEEAAVEAFREVPSMSREQFERIAQTLFTLANQLSSAAYQNVQQARFISELKQSQEEQRRLQTQLNQAQKMEAIGTLAGGIAHDFNNILGAIIGYAEMARTDSQPDSTIFKDLERVLEAGNRAKSLVRQILAFSRQHETECTPLQPAGIVKDAIKMLRPSLPSTIEINQDIDSEVGLILADPTQIHQIIMNFGTNAFHAMEDTGGNLTISLKETTLSTEDLIQEPYIEAGNFVRLSISDSGQGIAPDIKDKIFDPYFTTKEIGKGTGMGLSITHGIVKSSGGFISYDSEPGKGTTFNVFLPVIEKEVLPETGIISEIPTGTERILCIDDEKIIAKMSKDLLERLGYHVTVRHNGLEALETFQGNPDKFDLVITDQTMPGMTGADMARKMIQIRPDIPIILCTGYSTIISEKKAKSMGIKAFLMKPISKRDIAVLIRKVLDVS